MTSPAASDFDTTLKGTIAQITKNGINKGLANYRRQVKALRDGVLLLDNILSNTESSQVELDQWCSWVEEHLIHVANYTSTDEYLDCIYTFCHRIVRVALDLSAEIDTLSLNPESHHAVNKTEKLQQLFDMICPVVKSIEEAEGYLTTTVPHALHTTQWFQLLADLLNMFKGGRVGGYDATQTISDILWVIVADTHHPEGRNLAQKEGVFGRKLLGKLLFESTSSMLSVNLFRTLAVLVTTATTPVQETTILNDTIGRQGWSTGVRKQLIGTLKKADKTRRVAPEYFKSVVNIAAKDASRFRPQGFQVTAFSIDGKDQCTSSKSRRRVQEGGLIAYLDGRTMLVKLFDKQGEEFDVSFRFERIRGFQKVAADDNSFSFTTTGSSAVVISINSDGAEEFSALVSGRLQELDPSSRTLGTGGQGKGDVSQEAEPPAATLPDDDTDSEFAPTAKAQQATKSARSRLARTTKSKGKQDEDENARDPTPTPAARPRRSAAMVSKAKTRAIAAAKDASQQSTTGHAPDTEPIRSPQATALPIPDDPSDQSQPEVDVHDDGAVDDTDIHLTSHRKQNNTFGRKRNKSSPTGTHQTSSDDSDSEDESKPRPMATKRTPVAQVSSELSSPGHQRSTVPANEGKRHPLRASKTKTTATVENSNVPKTRKSRGAKSARVADSNSSAPDVDRSSPARGLRPRLSPPATSSKTTTRASKTGDASSTKPRGQTPRVSQATTKSTSAPRPDSPLPWEVKSTTGRRTVTSNSPAAVLPSVTPSDKPSSSPAPPASMNKDWDNDMANHNMPACDNSESDIYVTTKLFSDDDHLNESPLVDDSAGKGTQAPKATSKPQDATGSASRPQQHPSPQSTFSSEDMTFGDAVTSTPLAVSQALRITHRPSGSHDDTLHSGMTSSTHKRPESAPQSFKKTRFEDHGSKRRRHERGYSESSDSETWLRSNDNRATSRRRDSTTQYHSYSKRGRGSKRTRFSDHHQDDSTPSYHSKIHADSPDQPGTKPSLHSIMQDYGTVMADLLQDSLDAPDRELRRFRRSLELRVNGTTAKWTKETAHHMKAITAHHEMRQAFLGRMKDIVPPLVGSSARRHEKTCEIIQRNEVMWKLPETLF